MHFGLFGGVSTKRGPGLGDGDGYRSFFMVKHHCTRQGQVSASTTPLAYLAAKTRTIRLGTAEVMPSFQAAAPVRVAAE